MNFGDLFVALKDVVHKAALYHPTPAQEDPGADQDVPVDGAQQPFTVADDSTLARLQINCLRSKRNGVDELRQTWDPAEEGAEEADQPGYYLNTLCGNRILQVEVLVECHDQRDSAQAWPIAENIRTRLEGDPYFRDLLKDIDVNVAESSDVEAVRAEADGLAVSAVRFELTLNASVNYDTVRDTTIEIVNTTSEITA